ncbi:Integrase catalytic domain-containing protein [Durusdinium trenchii]|uniref:Integrase catalytic domain-containing protein n=1 Tax=Durusdinium trenchii TaxID=1381693 RepID=A0ABP0KYM7_9DINO
MVSEAEVEIDPEEEDELVADGGDPPQATLDEVLQMEAEGLAQDLEEAAECGLDSDTLQQIEESVETAAEALLTMREAKVKLQEVKKDRGYGRASPADQKGKMNPKKQSSKHPCFDCNLPGHWAGDPECTKPGQGLGRKNKPVKQVKVTEALNTEVSPPVMEDGGHEVLAVGAFPMTNEFLDGSIICFWTSLVPVPSLGLLLGRDFLEAIGADMHFAHRTLRCEHLTGKPISLKQLAAGHFLLPLVPATWSGVGPQRWKRLGVDGVLELQLSPVQWLRKKLSFGSSLKSSSHDHLLTEQSVRVGHLVCAVLHSPDVFGSSVQAQGASMKPEGTTDRNSSSSSLTTSPSNVRRMDDCRQPLGRRERQHGREGRKMEADVPPHGRKVKPMIEILKNKKPAVSPAKANTAEEISASSSSPPARLLNDNPKNLAVQQQEMRAMMEQMSRELALLRSQVTPEMEVDLSSEPSLIPDSPQDASPVNFTEAEIRELNGQAYEELYGANLTAQFGDDIPAEVMQEIRLGLRDGAGMQMKELLVADHEQEMLDFMTEETFFQPFELCLPDDKVLAGFEALQNESQPKNVLISKNETAMPMTPALQPPVQQRGVPGADLPPVRPEELVQVAQQAAPIPSMVGSSALPSRRISDVTGMGPAPGSPVPELIRRAGTAGSLLARQIAQARDLAEESGGMKRPAEVDKGEDELMKQLQHGKEHPLRVIASLADIDKQQPLDAKVKDHGSWGGRWDLPSRSEWQLHQKLGWSWPTGSHDAEALLASAAHKELFWRNMSPEEKIAFREAAKDAWKVWEDNQAIEVLPMADTSNMFVDCGTKDMDESYLHRILASGRWCYTFNQAYVKQGKPSRKQLALSSSSAALDGEPLNEALPVFVFLQQLAESPGWHHKGDIVTHVAHHARSYRSPIGRYEIEKYPIRTTYARFDLDTGISHWRILEDHVKMRSLTNRQALLSTPARVLISIFTDTHANKKIEQLGFALLLFQQLPTSKAVACTTGLVYRDGRPSSSQALAGREEEAGRRDVSSDSAGGIGSDARHRSAAKEYVRRPG